MSLSFIQTFIENPLFYSIVGFVVMILPTYIKLIQPYWSKRSRTAKLAKALDYEVVSGITREHLEAEMEKEQYGIATGLYLEKEFREPTIRMYRSFEGKVEFFHFKQAYRYINFDKPEAPIQIANWHHWAYWAAAILFSILWVLSSITITIGANILATETAKSLFIMFFGFVLMGFAVVLIRLTRPVFSAKEIKKHLEIAGKKTTSDHAASAEPET